MQYTKKQFVKPEFEVAKRMVGLLYFQVRQQSRARKADRYIKNREDGFEVGKRGLAGCTRGCDRGYVSRQALLSRQAALLPKTELTHLAEPLNLL